MAAATIAQLEAARQVLLGDASHYAAVVPGVMPIIGHSALLEVRIWGADFLAETFASPMVSFQAKEGLGIKALPLIHELLEAQGQDEAVVKSITQAATNIYGPIFKHIVNNPHDSQTWAWMSAIKANILKRFDTDSIGIRVCCIKFVQKVVLVQTPGLVPDPRRPERPESNDISSASVPRDHPLIPPPRLEAEASGLLDRLLTVFYEDDSDVVLIDATLNGFSFLVRNRASVANKVVSAILNFNPFKRARPGMPLKEKVRIQSMERTTCAFLANFSRRNPNGRISARLSQLKQLRLETFDDANRKRGPPVEPTDGLDNAKRVRVGAQLNGRQSIPPLPPGPVSVAQLYTLTRDESITSFDVKHIPIDLVVKIALPILQRVDAKMLDESITAVRSRFLDITRQPPPQQAVQAPAPTQVPPPSNKLDVEEDDYEPEFEPTEDSEQIVNKMDALPADDKPQRDIAIGPFKLAQPPPLTLEEAEQLGKGSISRVFSMMSKLQDPSKAAKPGLNRLAGSGYDKDAWLTVITRLATRTSPPTEDDKGADTNEDQGALVGLQDRSLSDGIRETLWKYIVEDFRHRIDIAIAWLNEEWYNEKVVHSKPAGMDTAPLSQQNGSVSSSNYEKWVLKLLDAIIPYLDANDKVLVRFLGEVPEISPTVIERVKVMARDPDRVSLTVKAIYYLVAFKPPSKEAAIDALEDLWHNYPDAKASVRPLLSRVRPEVLATSAPNGVKKESSVTPASPLVPEQPTESAAKAKVEPSQAAAVG